MKKSLNKIAAFGLVIAFAVSSCKKDSSSDPQPLSTEFTYKVDGSFTVLIDSSKALIYTYTPKGTRWVEVLAYRAGREIFVFDFEATEGNKVANTTFETEAFLSYFTSPINSFDSQSGSLNLTTCDTIGNKLEGNFNFVGKEYPYSGSAMKTITEGHMIVTNITK